MRVQLFSEAYIAMMIEQKMMTAPTEAYQSQAGPRQSRTIFGLWQIIQSALIVSYAFSYTIPLLSVIAGFMATYMIISLTQRGFLWQPSLAAALTVALGVALGSQGIPLGARLVFLCWALLPALVFGASWSLTRSVSMATLALALTVTALIVVLFSLAGDTVYQILDIQESWIRELAPSVYASLSGPLSALRWLLPAFIGLTIATPAFCAWVIVITQNDPETRRAIVNWRLSRPVFWLASLALTGRFAAGFAEQESIVQVCDNVLLILLISFSVTGLFVVEYLFRHFRLHIALRAVIYTILVITLHIGGMALALAGMLDTLINFRGRLEPS